MSDAVAPMHAQDKLAFLLSLVPYLMDHERVAVATAAEHFGVPAEQIRDAVRLIAVSGVPGTTQQYQHGDLFDIAWDTFDERDEIVLTHMVAIDDSPRFSAREAAALIAGLQYLSALPENANREAISSLMAKLTHGASAAPSQVAVAGSESDASLKIIRDAVVSSRQVEFGYLNSRGEYERRRVDPLRIESVDQDWYLRGWCHLREAVRTFRLDRMSDLAGTADSIVYRPTDVTLPESLFEGSPEDIAVDIEVSATALPLIADYIPDGARPTVIDGRVHTTLRMAHYGGLSRLVNSLAGVVIVTGPGEARRAVADWAVAGLSQYEPEGGPGRQRVD